MGPSNRRHRLRPGLRGNRQRPLLPQLQPSRHRHSPVREVAAARDRRRGELVAGDRREYKHLLRRRSQPLRAAAGPLPWPATTITAPGSLALASSPVGDTITKTITLKNTGAKPMFLLGVTSSNPAEFAEISSTCPSSGTGVAHSGTCTVTIGFTPEPLGARATHNAYVTRQRHHLPADLRPSAAPARLTCRLCPPATHSAASRSASKVVKTITVTQLSDQVGLAERSLRLQYGSNAGDFSVTGGTCTDAGNAIDAVGQVDLFADRDLDATTVGTESATMTVTDSPDPASPSGYQVSFTTAETVPESLSAKKLSFGKRSPRRGPRR